MNDKLYVMIPQNTGWLNELLINDSRLFNSDKIMALRKMDGEYVYMVDQKLALLHSSGVRRVIGNLLGK